MTLRHQLAGSLSAFLILLSPFSHAESGRSDYDLDNDGLIEINDLADLHEIRNNLDGTTLYGSGDGCPDDGCNGFELTTDLSFDTNGDGKITELDDYWNEGEGWLPIAHSGDKFSAVFDGNYHTIQHLLINRPRLYNAGLFASIENAEIHRLKTEGAVTGDRNTGLIVGQGDNSQLSEVIAYGQVSGGTAGGIVGKFYDSRLFACAAHIRIPSAARAGGVAGNLRATDVQACYATGSITGSQIGGLVGSTTQSGAAEPSRVKYSYTTTHLHSIAAGSVMYQNLKGSATNVHWATDRVNALNDGIYLNAGDGGFSIADLKCPTAAGNTSCVTNHTLYENWNNAQFDNNDAVWNFGNNQQLPVINWGGKVFRDSDNDGVEDQDDAWPDNAAAYLDSDEDGYPDFWTVGCDTQCQNSSGLTIDHYPNNDAVSLNADADGFPDAWNSTCDASCQTRSDLIIDQKPGDRDNDGVADIDDSIDNNIAGNTGDIDADSDGLVDISTLEQFNAIRFQFDGAGLKLSEDGELVSSGCPLVIINGKPKAQCVGYELLNDLDFDTNGNGEFDAGDTFWNDGKGFEKIPALRAILEGNNHFIYNLNINSTDNSVGLIGSLSFGAVRNLGFINAHIETTQRHAGAIAVTAGRSTLDNLLYNGVVKTDSSYEAHVGGFIGYGYEGLRLNRLIYVGEVTTHKEVSGGVGSFIGFANLDISISNSFSTAILTGRSGAGFIGRLNSKYNNESILLHNSYFAGKLNVSSTPHNGLVPSAGGARKVEIDNSYWLSGYSSYRSDGFTLAQLICPTAADNNDCADEPLYSNWSDEIWNFGDNQQLPGLTFAGKTYRDSDGDSVRDEVDAWPYNNAASKDKDNDNHPDIWNATCDAECIANSGLELDQFPQYPQIWSDGDLDGKPELCDTSCANALASEGILPDNHPNDFDNDGIPDSEDSDTNGVLNADADNNGLIEVRSLADLNAIRFQLNGIGKRTTADGELNSSGCPVVLLNGSKTRHCHGYELAADLDFDTNGDNQINELDNYWNDGLGWLPLTGTTNSSEFSATLNGNGHTISNLYINRPETRYSSLVGMSENATLKNLIFDGELSSIKASSYASALIGYAEKTDISNIVITSRVKITSVSYAAGVVGYATQQSRLNSIYSSAVVVATTGVGAIAGSLQSSSLTDALAAGSVFADRNSGGAVGYFHSSPSMTNVLSVGFVKPAAASGGLTGDGFGSRIINSYWATDTTKQQYIRGHNPNFSTYYRVDSNALKCATQANITAENSDCIELNNVTLFKEWNEELWDFGTDQQLPGIKILGRIYRDSDGDGTLDENDRWPNNFAASHDKDNDNHPDQWASHCATQCQADSGLLALDAFPQYPGAWRDDDFDGLVEDCDQACIDASDDSGLPILVADQNLLDFDNDGLPDLEDPDRDGDGNTDADSDHDGLIEINTVDQFNAIRYQLNGKGLKLTSSATIDSSGCPYQFIAGSRTEVCRGYELTADIDFDTNTDGKITEADDYWDSGKGWDPIGSYSSSFAGELNGNGHRIKNLYINRPGETNTALFHGVENARIHNLSLSGNVTGWSQTSLLTASATNSDIHNLAVLGNVKVNKANNYNTAGVVAHAENVKIRNVFISGSVHGGSSSTHSLVGAGTAEISHSISTSYNTKHIGSVVSPADSSDIKESVYWLNHDNPDGDSAFDLIDKNSVGLTLAQLQCAINANTTSENSSCIDSDQFDLYKDWSADAWDFGTTQQLPGLKLGNRIIRDSDGDGVLDGDDRWPNSYAAAIDSDSDNHPDFWTPGCNQQCQQSSGLLVDKFPTHNLAWQDDDFDGLPENCDASCQAQVGQAEDQYPNDSDNDNIQDHLDNDINNDGKPDADANHNGLVDIATLDELNLIRYELKGYGQRANEDADLDSSGCPMIQVNGEYIRRCHGYELTADLDFDTNGDGQISAQDDYWNNGTGWQPIGRYFIAEFNGNGFSIKNLYINNPLYENTKYYALFNSSLNANFNNLIITGNVSGNNYSALLVGYANETKINNVVAKGSVTAGDGRSHNRSALMVAYFRSSEMNNSVAYGFSEGPQKPGGLSGYTYAATINNSYSIVSSQDEKTIRPASGQSVYRSKLSGTYWQGIEEGQASSSDLIQNSKAFKLTQLQCAVSADTTSDSDCHNDENTVLFAGWSSNHWDFGTAQQLPALKVGDNFYRDSDGDRIADSEDSKPFDYDNDGSNDNQDDFIFIAAASQDDDNDGMPDSWNDGCNEQCQSISGLTLDTLPNDTDNDGVTNNLDTDNSRDNGKPRMLAVPATLYATVNNTTGTQFYLDRSFVAQQRSALNAEDIVDDELNDLTFRAFIGERQLLPDFRGGYNISAGRHTIEWVAEDKAGNRSDAMEQQVYIYPKVKFAFNSSIIGEPDTAQIALQLTGPSPEYPVEIPVKVVVADSTASQADVNESFDITATHTVRIERGDTESPRTTATISVAVLQEFIDEQDETLVLNISAKPSSSNSAAATYGLPEETRRHTLTILDMKDTDQDGMPDVCNTQCRQVGKTEDNDDDNDGIADVLDGYPIIAIGNHADFDGDGRPDTCDNACQASGMMADPDDDNDGINDADDAFRLNAAASIDVDKDGLPDSWNSACSSSCRTGSGLMLDAQLNDTDNDGVKNDQDSDNNRDNGKPTLLSVAPAWYSPVNNEDGTAYIIPAASLKLITSQLTATDIVDSASAISYQGILNNSALDLSGETAVEFPVGLQTISWYAVDSSGNRSEPMEQKLYIYPEVRFSLKQSQSAENVTAEIQVELSGISPEYPVEIPVKLNLNNSTASALDLSPEFETTAIHTVMIELGDGEMANTTGMLQIPILEDNISEEDETLQIQIANKPNSQGGNQLGYALPADGQTHLLTITEMNLPPSVTLELRQGGEIVSEVKQDAGLVTITAVVTDPNIQDQHILAWDLNDLGLAAQAGETVTVNPQGLPVQEYKVVVTVTDNATPALSAQAEISFEIKAAKTEPTPGNGSGGNNGSGGDNSGSESSGGGGGGAIHLWYLMMLFIGVYGLRRKRR